MKDDEAPTSTTLPAIAAASDSPRPRGRPIEHGLRRPNPVKLEPLVNEKVEILERVIAEDGARWIQPADHLLIRLTARNLVILDQLWSYLIGRGAIDSHGRPRGAMKIWQTANNVVTRQLGQLGLSPLARAELGANLAGGRRDLAMAMRLGAKNAAKNEGDDGAPKE